MNRYVIRVHQQATKESEVLQETRGQNAVATGDFIWDHGFCVENTDVRRLWQALFDEKKDFIEGVCESRETTVKAGSAIQSINEHWVSIELTEEP